MKNLSTSEININAPLNKLVSKQNEKLALKIGKFMTEVLMMLKEELLVLGLGNQEKLCKLKKVN